MKIEFQALVKEVKSKALVSLDKGYEIKLQGEDEQMKKVINAPANKHIKIIIEWDE